MPTLEIDPKYRLGVAEMDREHAQLIQIVNDLKAGLQGETMLSGEGIPRIVDRLLQYTNTHFNHEEQLMSENQYPGLAEHHKKHAELKRQIEQFASELSGQHETMALKINLFMTIWLFEHIIKDDADFAKHYRLRHEHP